MKTPLLLVRQGKYRKLQAMARRWKRLPEWLKNLSDVEIEELSLLWRAATLDWKKQAADALEASYQKPLQSLPSMRCKRCHEFMGSMEEMARHECKE